MRLTLRSNEEAITVIMQAIDKAGYKAGENIFLALDCAASEFYKMVNTSWQVRAIKPLIAKVLAII